MAKIILSEDGEAVADVAAYEYFLARMECRHMHVSTYNVVQAAQFAISVGHVPGNRVDLELYGATAFLNEYGGVQDLPDKCPDVCGELATNALLSARKRVAKERRR